MTGTEKSQFVGGLVSLVVYIVVAWAAAKVLDVAVWRAYGVGVQTEFTIVPIQTVVEFLKANQ